MGLFFGLVILNCLLFFNLKKLNYKFYYKHHNQLMNIKEFEESINFAGNK